LCKKKRTGSAGKQVDRDFTRVHDVLVPYPVLLEKTIIIYHNGDLITPFKPPQLVIVYFLYMAEPVTGKIILHTFEKLNFLCKERIFVLFGLAGEIEAQVIRDFSAILSMLIKPGELPPVNVPVFVRFAVKHIRVNAADSKTAVINPAPAVFQKPAGSGIIILCPYCIPGNVENAILVAQFGRRGRFESGRINCFYCGYVTIEQEYMAVECPRTALSARRAPEPCFLNNASETFHGIFKKAVTLLCQRRDA